MEGWTTIGINRERHARLAKKKQVLEETIGQRFSWGVFLLILAGLHPVDEFVSKEEVKWIAHAGEMKEAKLSR